MIALSFRLNPSETRLLDGRDIAGIDKTELMYSLFCGDFLLRDGEVILDHTYGWAPLLHVAAELTNSIVRLQVGNKADVWFIESDDRLYVSRGEGSVRLWTNYAPGVIEAPYDIVHGTTLRACRAFIEQITTSWPTAEQNPVIAELTNLVSSRDRHYR